MTDALPSPGKAEPRLPIEVCERVIEEVYDDYYSFVSTSLATLSNCALVCRAWRPRAQRILFEYVLLRDKDALNRFAQLLDASPELGTYVHTLELRGYLHVPYSPAVLFLTALRGKLTNLAEIYIYGFDDDEKAANPLPEGEKELPFLPIYQYFPSLLTSISHIRRLAFVDVRFPSFGDFARFLSMLPNLNTLWCGRVSWAVLGLEPVCMAKRSSHDSRKMFLPNLEVLVCYDMDEQGRQRLLSALGPSLRTLWTKFPNVPPAVRIEHYRLDVEQETPSLALNLRSFPCLDGLYCCFVPFTQRHDQTLESLRDTLISWMASSDDVVGDLSPTQRCLYLVPADRRLFQREEFVALLRPIGPVVEAALCRKDTAEGDLQDQTSGDTNDRLEVDPCRAGLVVQDLGDRLEWVDWWRQAVAECFPTLLRWKRLYVYPTHAGNPGESWQDHDLTPQDYADRLQAMAEARHRRRHSTQDTVKKFLASRGILLRVRQMRKRYYQPTCLRRPRSSASLWGRTQNVIKTRIYSVSTFNML